MDSFLAFDVQSKAVQTMETLYIIATSRNLDTIKGRYEFLLKIIATLKSAKSNPQYPTLIQTALEKFKTIHPASVPQDYQLAALSSPDIFDFNEFYCTSLVMAMKRFCEEQSEEINALKKETARAKRVSKVVETIRSAQNELAAKCTSASSYTMASAELEKLAADPIRLKCDPKGIEPPTM
jgi:hypothetical protein